MSRVIRVLLTALLAITLVGCAHVPLARNTRRQARTLADIQQQQVLDNIAMFIADPGATPFYAVPTGGGTQVRQDGSSNLGLQWNPTTLTGESLNVSAKMDLQENWNLSAVNNPKKLRLMKCVYKYVLRQPTDCTCANCYRDLNQFFGTAFCVCNTPQFWLACGAKCDVPKCATNVGRYKGLHVWVLPGRSEQLNRVTMSILEIATISDLSLISRLADPESPLSSPVEITEFFKVDNGYSFTAKYEIKRSEYPQWYENQSPLGDHEKPNRKFFQDPTPSQRRNAPIYNLPQPNDLDAIRSQLQFRN